MKVCVIIALMGIVLLIMFLVLRTEREGFTLHSRDWLLCPPFLNERDAYLMPNSVVFVVQGYNYSDAPRVFRDGKVVTPLQYAWDYGNMAYYLTVDAPDGLCGSEWMLETSDFVEPIVYEGRSEKKMNVSLRRRRNGYHHWELGC